MISVSVELSELSVTLSGAATLVFPAHDTELSGTLLGKWSACLDASWFYNLMVERLLGFHEFLGYIFSPTRRKEESPSLGMLHCLPPSLHSSFPSCFFPPMLSWRQMWKKLDWNCVFAFIHSVAFCNKDGCLLLTLPGQMIQTNLQALWWFFFSARSFVLTWTVWSVSNDINFLISHRFPPWSEMSLVCCRNWKESNFLFWLPF